ncbi:MAG: DinB family protein [Saprospiraceae bacterium]
MSTICRPNKHESAEYYFTYINKVSDDNFIKTLKTNVAATMKFLEHLPLPKWEYRYAPGKWTIKEIMIHIIDTERIMCYRALRVARKDKTPMPGFEQDDYVAQLNSTQRSIDSILEEYQAVRAASVSLFKNFTDEEYEQIGTASGHPVSPRALGFIIAGHEIHHLTVIKERYMI